MNTYYWQQQEKIKSICKHMSSKSMISYHDWIMDSNHFHRETSLAIQEGYCVWAKPVLTLIKKSKTFETIASKPALWMIEDLKFKKGINKNPHIRGFLFRHTIFNPISWCLGNLKLLVISQKNKQVLAANKR